MTLRISRFMTEGPVSLQLDEALVEPGGAVVGDGEIRLL